MGGYFWFFDSYRGLALRHMGATYPKISFSETPQGAADSTAPELNGPFGQCLLPAFAQRCEFAASQGVSGWVVEPGVFALEWTTNPLAYS